MLRRDFLASAAAFAFSPSVAPSQGDHIAAEARKQIGVTKIYDPAYTRLAYPNGDIPRERGICADVVVRACRDALSLDLQKLVHEDMVTHFAQYPSQKTWHLNHADANIDHRRVLNLETFWQRSGAQLWKPTGKTAGNAFPKDLKPGDFLTWRLNGHLPHVGVVSNVSMLHTTVVHNWGNGAEETWLFSLHPHLAAGHFRWPLNAL